MTNPLRRLPLIGRAFFIAITGPLVMLFALVYGHVHEHIVLWVIGIQTLCSVALAASKPRRPGVPE